MTDISNGDYLRILSKVLSDQDISWFSVEGSTKGIRNLTRADGCWVINYRKYIIIIMPRIFIAFSAMQISVLQIHFCAKNI